MIRKLLAVSAVSLSLFGAPAWAEEEQYPAKGDSKPEAEEKVVKASSEALAETGTDTMPMVMAASGLIVVGGALVVTARRRRTDSLAGATS